VFGNALGEQGNPVLLGPFTACQGSAPIMVYQGVDQTVPQTTTPPELLVTPVSSYQPYVQSTALLPTPYSNPSPSTYTFIINVYEGKNMHPVATYRWDPWITVNQQANPK
jgi:hypothetical protein